MSDSQNVYLDSFENEIKIAEDGRCYYLADEHKEVIIDDSEMKKEMIEGQPNAKFEDNHQNKEYIHSNGDEKGIE